MAMNPPFRAFLQAQAEVSTDTFAPMTSHCLVSLADQQSEQLGGGGGCMAWSPCLPLPSLPALCAPVACAPVDPVPCMPKESWGNAHACAPKPREQHGFCGIRLC